MSRKKKWQALLGLLMILAMALAACGPEAAEPTAAPAEPTTAPAEPTAAPAEPTKAPEPTAAPESKGGGTLRVAYIQENDTLNPFTSQMTGEVQLSMIEGLTVSDDKNTYIPVLAKEIPTYENGGIVKRDDGKIDMTWHLQDGVLWHDGVEFTSADVCFTYDWLVSDGATMVYNQMDYKNISACQTPDKNTVILTWDVEYAPYAVLFDSVLPKHILEGQDVASYDGYNRSPIGTGPFKFVEWKAGEYIRVVRNEQYWRGPEYPYLDEVVYYFVPDPNTRLNGLKAGEYDIAEIDTTMAAEAATIPGYRVEMVDRNTWIHFGTSIKSENGAKLFSDKKVRQAMFYGIDRESIVNDLLEGTVPIAHTPITPASPYHNPNVTIYNYDPEKAKQMLDEAGWTVGADGIREKDGVRFSLTFLNRASRPQRVAIAEVIQALYKDLGIEVLMNTQEDKAYIETWVSGDWDATIAGWILPADPSFTGIFACGGSNNMTGYCDEELDAIMNEADRTLDFAKRQELMFKAQEMLMDGAYELPIHYMSTPFVLNAKFGNFKGSGTNIGSFWNMYEWNLDQ